MAALNGIRGIFPENFFKYSSVRAIGVGSVCYLGLKIHQYNSTSKWYGYLGKAIVATSAIGALHFSGILEDHKNVMKYWIPLPGLSNWGVSISLSTVTDSINNIWNYIFE